MNSLNTWALNISLITVVTGVLLAIVPNSRQKNTLKLVAVTSVLLCFIKPLINSVDESQFSLDFSAVNIDTSTASELVDGEVLEYAARELETELVDVLTSHGYTVKSAEIALMKYDDGTVEVERVYIYGVADSAEQNGVLKKVKELLGEDSEVEFK